MDKKLEAMLNHAVQQRNDAMNQVLHLVGELAALQEKVKKLEAPPAHGGDDQV